MTSKLTAELGGVWQDTKKITALRYRCGHCDSVVGPDTGWWCYLMGSNPPRTGYIYICPHCNRPTFFESSTMKQYPGTVFGNPVGGLPSDVSKLYDEARASMSVSAHTSAVLAARKILMNIAVNKGANEGQSFQYYVEFLTSKFAPESKDWVDLIRKKGNDANHEIALMSKDDAEDLLNFTEMLLKIVYEFPGRVSKKTV